MRAIEKGMENAKKIVVELNGENLKLKEEVRKRKDLRTILWRIETKPLVRRWRAKI